ncbi:MAG TPA: MlaD family protein [Lacibacter sp.]|nr:MlaD family protein [Lacibacter sp.]
MHISNETKVGALTVIAVTLLVLGYNFLKGNNITKRSQVIYARFSDVGALEISNPVKVKGFRIGNVYEISTLDKEISEVVVTINLQEDVNIPKNSVALITSSLTGTSSINIMPGNATEYLRRGDTLLTSNNPDLLGKVMNSLDPILHTVKEAVGSLKLVLGNLNSMFDAPTKNNLKEVIAHLNTSSANLAKLLNTKDGDLAKTLNNAAVFSNNLNQNNANLNATIENFRNTSQQLSDARLKETVEQLNQTVVQLNAVLEKANSKDGSLGLLLNDPKLYNNLENTSRSLNILLDDFKTHPKRYVSFSVFGKKDKSQPLTAPLADSVKTNQ